MAQRPTVQEFVNRWQQGTTGAQQRYTQGVQNSADWAGNTVAALPQMFQGLQAAMADGRIERGINGLGTAQWRNITLAKAGNWITGVSSPTAVQHMQAGATRLYTMLDTAQASINTMPRGDINQNIQRMVAFSNSMHASKQNA